MRISDLVNKVEPFRFEYDGFVLEGEYYKFKTTTPKYVKEVVASLPEVPENGTAEEIAKAQEARDKAEEAGNAKILADTIKSWNAEDDEGTELTPSVEVFERLPLPFTKAFLEHLRELREGPEKKESTPSPSG